MNYKIGQIVHLQNSKSKWKLEKVDESRIGFRVTKGGGWEPTGIPTYVYGFSEVEKGGRKMEQKIYPFAMSVAQREEEERHQRKHIRHSKRGKAFVAGRRKIMPFDKWYAKYKHKIKNKKQAIFLYLMWSGKQEQAMGGQKKPKYDIKLLDSGYNGDYHYWRFKIDGDDVEVDAPWYDAPYWQVVWGDATDFTGNKTEMLKRYPELRQAFKGRIIV